MISYIKGFVQEWGRQCVIVMTPGGVGYEVRMKNKDLGIENGDEIGLYTYLKVSDTAMDLYGFQKSEERDFFVLLLSVSGVGPKSALNILGLGSIAEIKGAIGRGDVPYLTAVQGMGKKTAERLVVELKGKVDISNVSGNPASGAQLSEVIDGLTSMGYSKEESKLTAKSLKVEGKSTEDLLKEALQMLSKR